jgi:hypothetical protein
MFYGLLRRSLVSYETSLGVRDSSVAIATDYGLGSIHGKGKRFISSPQRPDWPWLPSSLISGEYRLLPRR